MLPHYSDRELTYHHANLDPQLLQKLPDAPVGVPQLGQNFGLFATAAAFPEAAEFGSSCFLIYSLIILFESSSTPIMLIETVLL